MNAKPLKIAAALAALSLASGLASAQSFVLDTGTPPTGSSDPAVVLDASDWYAAEFAATAGVNITSFAAYLTQDVGQPGNTFTFDIYSASSFTNRANSRPAAVFSTTGTFAVNGWNTTSVNWTPSSSGDYWIALQVSSSSQTPGLDLPLESSTTTGTAPALAFAYAGSNGQYAISSADPVGLEITAVPEPSTAWLLAAGLLGVGAIVRRRRGSR